MRFFGLWAVLAVMLCAGCGGDDKSTPPIPTGACCAASGTCSVTAQADCAGTSTWTMAGVCDPNPCPQPPATGSCCLPGGVCSVTTQPDCTGTWTDAGVCDPNPCPQPPPPGMIWIPAGSVRLGQVGIAEPVNDFHVDGFYIDRYEVSNAQYKAFIDAGGYATEAYWNPVGWAWRVENQITLPDLWNSRYDHGGGVAGHDPFPVTGVSWWEADAYCRWAGKRLPTEAEWEKAAKGGCETHGEPGQCDVSDTPTYPWGEDLAGPRANYYQSGDPYESDGMTNTTPVGYYDGSNHGGYQTVDSPSPYGLYDMAGNVWEWCSSERADYPYDPTDGREDPPGTGSEDFRITRGGSWSRMDTFFGSRLQCAFRMSRGPNGRGNVTGFRCAKSG